MRRRVGPATTVTGPEMICEARIWFAVSEATVTCGGSRRTGSATGDARERRERPDEQGARGGPVEHASGRARRDRDVQPAPDELRLAMRRVERLAEQSELVVDGGAVGTDRRRDVLREQLQLEPAVAAHDADPAALARSGRDRGVPVDLDAHRLRRDRERPAAGDERHRHRGEPRRALLQQGLRGLGAHPPDVDPGDLRAVGEPVGGAGEEERDADREHSRSERQNRDPGPETGADDRAPTDGRSRGSHGLRHGSDGPRSRG